MKKVIYVLLFLAANAALVAACSPTATPGNAAPAAANTGSSTKAASAPAGDAAKGKNLYAASCASCHGPDAKGVPGLGKDLTNSSFMKGLSDAELVQFVVKGRPATDPANTTKIEMPARGGNPALKDQEIADIVAYLRSLKS